MGTLEQLHGVFPGMSAPYMTMNPHMMESRTAYGLLNRELCVASMGLGNGCAPFASQALQTVPAPSFKEAAWQLHEVTRQMQQLARQLSDARQQQAQHSASFHVLLKDLVSTQKQQHTALESLRSLQVEPNMMQTSPQNLGGSADIVHQLHTVSAEVQYYKHLAEEQQRSPQLHQLQSQVDAMQHDLAATHQLNSRLLQERSTLIVRLQQLTNQLVMLQDRPTPLQASQSVLNSAVASLDGAISSKLNEVTHQMAGLCVELADGTVSTAADDASSLTRVSTGFLEVSRSGREVGVIRREETAALLGKEHAVLSARVDVAEQGTSTRDLVLEQGAQLEAVFINPLLMDMDDHTSGRGEQSRGPEERAGGSEDVTVLHEQLQASRGQVDAVRQQLQDLQGRARQQQEEAEAKLVAVQRQLQTQQQQNALAAMQLQNLQLQLQQQQAAGEELQAAKAQLQGMQQRLQVQEEASQKLAALTDQLQHEQEAHAQLQAANVQLEASNTQLQSANVQLQGSHQKLEQQVDTLQSQLHSLQSECDQLQSKLTTLQQQTATSSQQPNTMAPRVSSITPDSAIHPPFMHPELLPSQSPTFTISRRTMKDLDSRTLPTLRPMDSRSLSTPRDMDPCSLVPNGTYRDVPEDYTPSSGTITPVGRGGPLEMSASLLLANTQLEALRRQRDEAESKLQSLLALIQQATKQEGGSTGALATAELAALQKLCTVLTPTSCVRSTAAVLSHRSSQLQATMQAALAEIKSLRADLTSDPNAPLSDGPLPDSDVDPGSTGKSLLNTIKEMAPLEGEPDFSGAAGELPPPPKGINPEWVELYYQDAEKFNELWQQARTSADHSGSLWPKQEPQELPLVDQLATQPSTTSSSHHIPDPAAMPHLPHDAHAVHDAAHRRPHLGNGPEAVTYPSPPPGLPDDLVALYYELGPDMFYKLLNDAEQEAQA